MPKYIHVQEGENIQRTPPPCRNTIIEKTITHLIMLSNPISKCRHIVQQGLPLLFSVKKMLAHFDKLGVLSKM
jgi:hypothetical protein